MFVGHENAGPRVVVFFMIMAGPKRHHLEPWAYLTDVQRGGTSITVGTIVATLAKSVGDLPENAHALGERGYDTF